MAESWERDGYLISTDRSRLNIDLIHDFLSKTSYWAIGRGRDVVQRSIDNSLSFGVYKGTDQVGFARVVTDYATFAWIADVFRATGTPWSRPLQVADGRDDIALRNCRGSAAGSLATKDAHALYERFGFIPLHRPERWMERPDPNMQESPDYWKNDPSS